jgi:hypothetical protein
MGFLKASKLFSMPRSTLENCVHHKVKDVHDLLNTKPGRENILSPELEEELANYCIKDDRPGDGDNKYL